MGWLIRIFDGKVTYCFLEILREFLGVRGIKWDLNQ